MSLFIAAQFFQECAYRFWIPAARTPQDELLTYLQPVDEMRSLLVMATIAGLLVAYIVLALRYLRTQPVLSVLGLLLGCAFVGFELSHRSLDLFVVGQTWARQLQNDASPAAHEAILEKFAFWTEFVHGWYFPLLLAYFLASCCFAATTASEWAQRGWHRLATVAFVLNAFRLLGRMLSMFAGQAWLNSLNDRLYFPAVLIINGLLAVWFFAQARHAMADSA